ncbi:hypothetical protein ABZP36_003458 [Zizania latifolia]
MIYSYKHGFSGFAAMLTESQAQDIAEASVDGQPQRHHPHPLLVVLHEVGQLPDASLDQVPVVRRHQLLSDQLTDV